MASYRLLSSVMTVSPLRRGLRATATLAASAAVVAGLCTVPTAAAAEDYSLAEADPSITQPASDPFYTPPAELPQQPGTLIRDQFAPQLLDAFDTGDTPGRADKILHHHPGRRHRRRLRHRHRARRTVDRSRPHPDRRLLPRYPRLRRRLRPVPGRFPVLRGRHGLLERQPQLRVPLLRHRLGPRHARRRRRPHRPRHARSAHLRQPHRGGPRRTGRRPRRSRVRRCPR